LFCKLVALTLPTLKKLMMNKINIEDTFEPLYTDIRALLLEARKRTYKAVNAAMIDSYWHIGRMIVEKEQGGKDRAAYSKQILAYLSKRLTGEFGEGFNQTNLKYMRLAYQNFSIRDALRHELTWTHYRLPSKVENEQARLFYRDESIDNQWSTRQLERQLHSFYYERLLSSQDKKGLIVETNAAEKPLKASDIIRAPTFTRSKTLVALVNQ
jgi:predicted nuclease of restriction endonuclease-like (RecB) superfamily